MDFLVKKTVLMPFALTVLCFFCSLPIKSNAQQLVQIGCNTVGAVEYRYSPQGECGTKEEKRTCCGGGQTSSGSFVLQNWSGWNEDCPELCVDKNPCTSDADCCGGRVCSQPSGVGASLRYCVYEAQDECLESEKPTCSIPNGTCSYICTCSNGKWVNCTKSVLCKSGFLLKGTTDSPCCENVNCGKTGPNNWQYPCYCATTGALDYGWVFQTDRHSCNMASSGTDPTVACGQCNASMKGAECTLRNDGGGLVGAPDINNGWNCTLYICQFGGGVTWN